MAYATVDEFEDSLDGDPTPAHPERLLDRASSTVDLMIRGCVYPVDSDGLPTEAADQKILRELTCLQAAYMADDDQGKKGQLSSLSTGGVSWSRAGDRPASRYSPLAVEYLLAHGFPGQGMVVRR